VTMDPNGAEPPSPQNPWRLFLLVLAAAGIVGGLVMSMLPVGPSRSVAFWFVLPVPVFAIVGGVGWAYTEIRQQEKLAPSKSATRRVLGYFGVLAVVAAIAIGGALIPSRLAPSLWLLFIPLWLIGGWWFRRQSASRRRRLKTQEKALKRRRVQ
jgi:hypothetical protein